MAGSADVRRSPCPARGTCGWQAGQASLHVRVPGVPPVPDVWPARKWRAAGMARFQSGEDRALGAPFLVPELRARARLHVRCVAAALQGSPHEEQQGRPGHSRHALASCFQALEPRPAQACLYVRAQSVPAAGLVRGQRATGIAASRLPGYPYAGQQSRHVPLSCCLVLGLRLHGAAPRNEAEELGGRVPLRFEYLIPDAAGRCLVDWGQEHNATLARYCSGVGTLRRAMVVLIRGAGA